MLVLNGLMPCACSVLLAAVFLLLPLGTETSLAGDGAATAPPTAAAPVPEESPAPVDRTFTEQMVGIGKEMEETHDRIEQDILERVIRLDDFFGNVKTEAQRKTRYQLRWRNSFRVDEDGNIQPGMTLRASVVLSRISDRLRLAITGEDEPDQTTPGLPQDPGNPGFDRTSRNARLVNTELRYGLVKTTDLDLFLGAGFRVTIPPEGFVRSRFQYIRNLDEVSLLRFGETLFIKNTSGLGETTEIDLERLLGRYKIVRWANSGTVSEEFRGMEWGTELSLARELSPRSAVTVGAGVYGNTRDAAMVGSYKIFTRYRRNFLRDWLFYELEPEVFWPRNEAGQYLAKFAITARIEVVFQGNAAKERTVGGLP